MHDVLHAARRADRFGKNYDFGIGYGMLVVNKRGVAKTSLLASPDRPARWTSKYGA